MVESAHVLPQNILNLKKDNFEINSVESVLNNIIKDFESVDKNYEEYTLSDVISRLSQAKITENNYEDIFSLANFQAVELAPNTIENCIRNIRYKDSDGITHAVVKINTKFKKIKLETYTDILPKQDVSNTTNVGKRVLFRALFENWSTEDGGINYFDGNIETRFKDSNKNVMAAMITKPDGKTIDTVVEYKYVNGKKSEMLHTDQYGQSITIYDREKEISVLKIDIDSDGCIYCITMNLEND